MERYQSGLLGKSGPVKARWGSAADESSDIRMDPNSESLQTIPFPHKELHEGRAFSAYFTNTTASSDNDRSVIAFKTPNSARRCHLEIAIRASNPANFILLEGPTLDNDAGTEAAAYNRYRGSARTSGILPIKASPTAGQYTTLTEAQIAGASLSGGTQLTGFGLAGGDGPQAVGGSERGSREWVLSPNTIYLFYLQNNGASANLHQINLDWYEHAGAH